MNFNGAVTLIKREYVNDAYGIQRETSTTRTVFCNVESITASEFFNASQTGLKPELRFAIYAAEYGGEMIVQYNGMRLNVYRVYQRSKDFVELYTTKDAGT